jgi:hypothetical protein
VTEVRHDVGVGALWFYRYWGYVFCEPLLVVQINVNPVSGQKPSQGHQEVPVGYRDRTTMTDKQALLRFRYVQDTRNERKVPFGGYRGSYR